jgi:hypothetical protein
VGAHPVAEDGGTCSNAGARRSIPTARHSVKENRANLDHQHFETNCACLGDCGGDSAVSVAELVKAVGNALNGCSD